jgi:hypothetical protein
VRAVDATALPASGALADALVTTLEPAMARGELGPAVLTRIQRAVDAARAAVED